MIGVFPGSFCPPTVGHIDIIERASKLVEKLYVVVGVNNEKIYEIDAEDRKTLLEIATKSLKNVEVVVFDGFMTDFCKSVKADVIIKSARNALDMQSIIDVERLTERYWQGETLVLIADKKFENISSSLVKELFANDKAIDEFVPKSIKNDVVRLLSN